MISSMGLLNTLAVLHAWVTEHQLQGMSESTTGWIFGPYGFFLYFCGAQIGNFGTQLPVSRGFMLTATPGPIFDAYDIKLLVVPGSIGIVASTICLSLSTGTYPCDSVNNNSEWLTCPPEFYHFLLSFGVLGGISASLLFYPAVSAISHWFDRRRSLATGICLTSGGLGGILFALIILYAAPSIGFPWAMRIVGLISAVSGALACLLLKKRFPHNKTKGGAIDLKALGDLKYAVVTLAVFILELSLIIPYTYISSYGIARGMDSQSAYMLNVVLNVAAIPGRALPGYFADRFGVFNVMIITTLASTVFILGLWLPIGDGDEAAITAFAALFGFWSGAAIALVPVCIGRVCETEDYGKRQGTSFFIASFGNLIGAPIAGAILQRGGGDYRGLIVLVGVTHGIATGVFVWARKLVMVYRPGSEGQLPWEKK
jgi:MFS family permease